MSQTMNLSAYVIYIPNLYQVLKLILISAVDCTSSDKKEFLLFWDKNLSVYLDLSFK